MRILIADSYYPPFLDEHYRARPGLEERPYPEQLTELISRSFGTGDAYSANLRALGHETADVILNCEPLQLRWARENGLRTAAALRPLGLAPGRLGELGRQATLHAVALAQIREFEPDVLYLQDLRFFRPGELRAFRRRGVRVAGQIASVPPPDAVLRSYDVIFSSLPHFVERLHGIGVEAEYLSIAFDERVLDRLRGAGVDPSPDSSRPHDAVHVGGLDPATHEVRIGLLEQVVPELGIEVWGYGADSLPAGSPILPAYRGEAWGLDMYAVLADSKIVVNMHEAVAAGNANNMRLFEATGAGAMLLTDRGANLSELFEPGREVVTFDDPEDLVAKVRHYLEHDAERLRIAAAGQQRTLSEHSYERRMAELVEILER